MPQTTSDLPEQKPRGNEEFYVTSYVPGGKLTCHKCGGFIKERDCFFFGQGDEEAYFHINCFNGYEHYYGLDRPID